MIDENKLIERIEEAFYDEKYINCSAKDILTDCYDTICEYFGQPCDWSMFKLICQECKELIMIENVEWS